MLVAVPFERIGRHPVGGKGLFPGRPNLVGPVPSLNCDTNPTTREPINCFDSTAFALPDQFTFGNAGRNILRGPKFVSTDLSLSLEPFRRRLALQLSLLNLFDLDNEIGDGVDGAGRTLLLGARYRF